MHSHNYKGLKWEDSVKQYLNDYNFKHNVYGKYTNFKTKNGKYIKIEDLSLQHIKNIVGRFGNTYIRENYPFLFYRYLKEVVESEMK